MQARANFYLMTAAATSVVAILFPREFQTGKNFYFIYVNPKEFKIKMY